MASNREGLGGKIRNILQARQMHDDELALSDAVTDPVEAHIEGLGHFLGDGGVLGDAHGALVITIEWGRRLDMSKICQNLSFVGGYDLPTSRRSGSRGSERSPRRCRRSGETDTRHRIEPEGSYPMPGIFSERTDGRRHSREDDSVEP